MEIKYFRTHISYFIISYILLLFFLFFTSYKFFLNDSFSLEKTQNENNIKIFLTNIDNEMKNLKDGEYSKEPVKTSYGYHIVYRIDQKEKPALEDIKDQIKEEIADEKISNDKNLYYVVLDKMRENANLKFEDTVLKEKYDNYMSQYK